MTLVDGQEELEKYIKRKLDFRIKLIELFIITISAIIVILSLADYKLLVIPVLMEIVAICYSIGLIIYDLSLKTDSDKIGKQFEEVALTTYIKMGFKEAFPLILYVLSVIVMGIIILVPLVKNWCSSFCG